MVEVSLKLPKVVLQNSIEDPSFHKSSLLLGPVLVAFWIIAYLMESELRVHVITHDVFYLRSICLSPSLFTLVHQGNSGELTSMT